MNSMWFESWWEEKDLLRLKLELKTLRIKIKIAIEIAGQQGECFENIACNLP